MAASSARGTCGSSELWTNRCLSADKLPAMTSRSITSLSGGIAAGALLLSAAPSMAASVSPTVVDGNPTCAQLGAGWSELKVDPPASGTYTSGDGALTVSVTVKDGGQSFDFSVADGELVEAAFAKGGSQGGNLYSYTPAGSGGDSDLEAPITGGSGDNAALSHISFCYVPDKTPPVVTPPAEEQPPTVTQPPATPETPATPVAPPVTPAQPAQSGVLGQVVSKHAKKAKKHKKHAKKARKQVKKVRVQAVRTPRFTG